MGEYIITITPTISSPAAPKLVNDDSDRLTIRVVAAASALSITAPAGITVEGNTTGGATGIVLGTPSVSGGTPPYTITNNAPSLFPLGVTIVTWTATDASSNSASDTQTVTVVDTTPPTITAPLAITVEGNTVGGATGVALGTPSVSDIVDPSPAVTNNAPAFFPLGATVVTWTATDASGNSATATQTVTVVDTTPPTITAVSSITVIVGAPSSVLPPPTVSDIVDPSPTVTNNAPSFFPPGTTTVTWTATDASGNSATATTTVTAIYNYGGILPPINPDGTSIFKLGSTVPVKFQLQDASGAFVTNAVAKIYVLKTSSTVTGTELEAVSTSAATTGNLFRYDLTSNQYIFNLATKPLSVGTWQIRIELDDGTSKYVKISLK